MTNLEWLKTLSAEELTEYLRKECLSCTYKDLDCGAEFCFKGHIEWLNAEHIPQIKSCPVCKGKMNTRWWGHGCYLVCEDCGMHFGLEPDKAEEGIIIGDYDKEVELIDDWNRRVDNADEQKHKEEIKPCKCGGKPFVNKDSVHYWVSCSCGLHGTYGTTREQAIEAWNRWADDDKICYRHK